MKGGILANLKLPDADEEREWPKYMPGVGWVSPVIGLTDPRFEPVPIVKRELEADEYVWPGTDAVN
jgi:hypothetical protein